MRAEDSSSAVRVIKPSSGWGPPDLRELWSYRELFFFMAWRDVKIRYKQTALGVLWAVLQPLLLMVVFSVFFGQLAGVPSDGIPYPLFALAALVPWTFFANAVAGAGNSLVLQERMLTKVYFPKLVVPSSVVLAGQLDLAVSLVVLGAVMLAFGTLPGIAVVTLPLFILLAAVTALGAGLLLAAVNVEYRDVRHTLPFLIQMWLFISPVAYPTSVVPEAWRFLYGLNPMVAVIDGFRWALLDSGEPPTTTLVAGCLSASALLVGALVYFRRVEHSFADVV